jgi:hypothetical protein
MEAYMNRLFSASIWMLLGLACNPFPATCAEKSTLNTTRQNMPTATSDKAPAKPAISEITLLRSQMALLRQDLEKEKVAREKMQTEMQNKINFLVGLLNLTSQKVTKLESHTHEYSGAPFGFITKANFGNIPADALIPFVAQEKVGKGVKPKTGPPLQ